MRKALVILLVVVGMIANKECLLAQNNKEMVMGSKLLCSPAFELKTNMRKLWEDHIVWTRNVILCLVDGLPGYDQSLKRLLQNQVDIGNIIKPYYGDEAGDKLTELLFSHVNISTEVVKAANEDNITGIDKANKKWIANADEISLFFSKVNPNWKLEEMKSMMYNHLLLTTSEALARIKRDYNADVVAFDAVHSDILKMADMLSDGIVKQFPDKFGLLESKM